MMIMVYQLWETNGWTQWELQQEEMENIRKYQTEVITELEEVHSKCWTADWMKWKKESVRQINGNHSELQSEKTI